MSNQIKAKEVFYSVTSISNWAGTENGVLFLDGDDKMPYVERDGMFYYYGLDNTHVYHLIATSSRDLGAN
jgi:hypothetical protein